MEKVIVFALLLVNVQLVVGTCSSETAGACSSGYNACVTAAGTSVDQVCNCFGAYSICLLENDCINATTFQNLLGNCEASGCTTAQCTGSQNAPTSNSPVSGTPIASPFNAPVSGCSAAQATLCANEYQSCIQEAGTDINAICNCYGPYFTCLYDFSCLTLSQYESVVQTCAQSGCTLQQCEWNTVVAPTSSTPSSVSEPTSSTPSYSSTPVGAPVNAPFAPPATVSCLQPWELVLIVVGSVLAGIGLAAVVGAIIYLSRRSSANKTSTDYTKLRDY